MSPRVAGSLLMAFTLLAGFGVQGDSRPVEGWCPTATQVRVATAPAGLAAHREVADAFEQWVTDRSDGCRLVDLYLYPVVAERMTTAIRDGWAQGDDPDHRPLRDIGPHPDLWLPERGTDVPVEEAGLAGVLAETVKVAETPIVLGVPVDQATGLDPDGRDATRTWSELFAEVNAAAPGGTGVIRGDPAVSATALMATVKLYRDGEIEPGEARTTVERWIERTLDSGGYPPGDEDGLLCRQREIRRASRNAPLAAVVLTEQALIRYNTGLPSAAPCVQEGRPSEADRLVAFYPTDAPVVDQNVVRLRWADRFQSANGRAYGRLFVRWLQSGSGPDALLRAGARPPGRVFQRLQDGPNGILGNWPFSQVAEGEPDPDTLRAVADVYAEARRPGRFLVALDASGSMGAATADPTRTRFEVSVAAVQAAVARMGGRDEFGLLTFSGSGRRSVREVLPISPRPAGGEAVGQATEGIRPTGGTPLYEGVRRGSGMLRKEPTSEQLRVLVVVTDGQDTSGQSMPTTAETAGVRVFVIGVGEGTCDVTAVKRLVSSTTGRCFDASLASLERTLNEMFGVIWDSEEG